MILKDEFDGNPDLGLDSTLNIVPHMLKLNDARHGNDVVRPPHQSNLINVYTSMRIFFYSIQTNIATQPTQTNPDLFAPCSVNI
ncbi:hypothetical protein [Candidatus Nitrosocosmicus sp. SS]|uniref:hypothetical protein n=1 Tax=Candidatus Nitrosocosmicus agrestis TaxID=2563600 RepID=UPI00122DE645|nr:hypothetical protein [Candidatus Nitrosocosmicus sp. SS]KAA2280483.1 hypothetical protein F1Z66_10825 [Candidatus Nitrosocosmicus sp. SS]KAF0869262.1 hypothetical protein E5N71_06030 [Candidatus Nitrosocosmicus sp. SS]MDR4492740.1 hypothetical protein [Candidatus Nitrosocosmicus sp.]